MQWTDLKPGLPDPQAVPLSLLGLPRGDIRCLHFRAREILSHLFLLGGPQFFFPFFLRPFPLHMEVPGPEAESELRLQGYTTATATWHLSCNCDPHGSLWPCWILNPQSEAKGGTRILTETTLGP